MVVTDADEVCVKTKGVSARIAIGIKDEDDGGRSFNCNDLEGRLWSFGTYGPLSE